MFTGIVRATGTIAAVEPSGGDVRLTVHADGLPWADYTAGDSIAVDGVCLTAVAYEDNGFVADVSAETLGVTTLGDAKAGDRVNVEPALRAGDALGGHLVSGHVDCVGVVLSMDDDARSLRIAIEIPREFARYVARKGSVCVDGVSLTINEVSGNTFSVNIIPHTAESTTIGAFERGTRVNIEVDVLARYVARMLDRDSDRLSIEFLREHGYA